jgi:tetratricopeptide (TPR) repeat protein
MGRVAVAAKRRLEGAMKRAIILVALLAAGAMPPVVAQRIKLSASLADLEKVARKDSNDAAATQWRSRWNDKHTTTPTQRAPRRPHRARPAAYTALSFLPYARRSSLADEQNENRVPTDWKPRLEESDRMYRQAFMIDPLVELRLGDAVFPRSTQYLDALKFFFGEWFADYRDGLDQYYLAKYQAAYDRFQRVFFAINGDRHADRLWNTLLYWHGLAAAQVGRHDEAVWDFQTILNRYLDTENKKKDSTLHVPLRTNEFRYILGVMKQRAGQFNEAIDLFREALQNDIGLYMAHVRLAQIYEDHNMLPQAVAERRAAVNTNPDDPSLLLDLGKTLARANQWIDAEKALQDAVAANARDPRPYYFLGSWATQNKTAEARVAFNDFIARAPSRYGPQVADAKQRLNALQ